MSSDNQYTALGPAAVGFQTTSNSIDVGADIAGNSTGIKGHCDNGDGVLGVSHSPRHAGVSGNNDNPSGGFGVWAQSAGDDAVRAVCTAKAHAGVSATNDSGGYGVWARGNPAVYGVGGGSPGSFLVGVGVKGESDRNDGVVGVSHSPVDAGVHAISDVAAIKGGKRIPMGVWAECMGGDAVFAHCTSDQHAGVSAVNDSGGFGVWARGTPAGHFVGNVEVTGTLTAKVISPGGDCSEEFDVTATVQNDPGTVMVIDHEGILQASQQAYDKRVAGVISGAGNLKPGIILGKQESQDNRVPIALVGRVYCKVDAKYAPIEVGDLLTTSPTVGHAMKADNPLKAFGSVIGKAMRPLQTGQGLIPILIALQ